MIEKQAISLLEYNVRIKRLLASVDVQRCWITAELSDVAVRGGHCYLELVQKDDSNTRILAKNRAVIWANVFARLKFEFESATGMAFASGLKLMVEVTANYHEQYGLSLVISDINPEYTLGGMAMKRREILRRLAEEGIIDMNKELAFPEVPQRIAVVSAEGAAGYGDFMNQLENNPYGVKFYTKLFPAVMQGERTVLTVMAALDKVNDNLQYFDCVVIIRGGGATSELHCFDDYSLAAYVAQFPLPVIVGIGHERDVTVLDDVAAMRVKTPTAAAEWLIAQGETALSRIGELSNTLVALASGYVARANEQLAYYTSSIPLIVQNRVSNSKTQLGYLFQTIKQAGEQQMLREKMRLQSLEDKVQILSPQNTLRRGYSLTLKNGKAVTNTDDLKHGDMITTMFADGEVKSIVE